jgi:hypothetical protein
MRWNRRNEKDRVENNLSSISQAGSLEKMGEFWDTHDFTQFDTDALDVEFTISSKIAIEPEPTQSSAMKKVTHGCTQTL